MRTYLCSEFVTNSTSFFAYIDQINYDDSDYKTKLEDVFRAHLSISFVKTYKNCLCIISLRVTAASAAKRL
jgi:hypothetical protein